MDSSPGAYPEKNADGEGREPHRERRGSILGWSIDQLCGGEEK
jgi:hypothetical protein